ncbi:MAG TPA: hypothetical protein VHV83_01520 [Armatimonadota bacterium]|nr:hypothetical protein [Armatimonadota bacterium]
MKRSLHFLSVMLMLLIAAPFATSQQGTPPTTRPSGGNRQMNAQMRQHMMMLAQNIAVMVQNTAIWTPQGLVVLQGNRVLFYSTDLRLLQTVTLPLPPATGGTMSNVSGMIPAKLIPTDDGLIVVRGQQIIRIDRNYHVVNQVTIPTMPALTPSEQAAICPLCQHMQMMMTGGMTPQRGQSNMPMPENPPATTQPRAQ